MSTNCMICIVNERTGSDLFCDDCREKENVKKPDKEIILSVTKEGDALVRTGGIGNLDIKYYGEYSEALEAMGEICKSFVEAHKEV